MLTAMTLLALLGCVGYVLLCWAKPFGPCQRCRGLGEIVRFGKLRTCPRCRGRKLRLRVGRRAHNAWRRTYDNGAR
jgi:DnaJ-class molecular chaperone